MTNAVLLGAGQGRRLSPLTDNRPKCLVEVAGRPLLDWQLRALATAGVTEATVVTGFGAAAVETALAVIAPSIRVTCRHNPFFAVADNIGSCWVARDLFGDDTLLINGDTLFDPRIARRVLDRASAPVTVTIDAKAAYDVDDMKVRLAGDRLARIGKTLEAPVDGESIGMIRFRAGGGARFAAALDETLRDPAALSRWYLSVIDALAADGEVGTVSIEGLPWAEVDYPHDLPIAAARVAAFAWGEAGGAPALAAPDLAAERALGGAGGRGDPPMSADEIEARVLELVSAHARNDITPGPQTDIISEAGMDSVAVMDFVLDLEESFDITIPLDRLTDIRTVSDVVAEVRSIVAESAH